MLALLGAHHILHISGIRVNLHFPTYIPYKSNPDVTTVTQTYQALCIHDEVYSELLSIH